MAFIHTRRDKGNSVQRDAYKDYSVRDDQLVNHAKRWPRFETLQRGWEMAMVSQKASEQGSEIHGHRPRRNKTQFGDQSGTHARDEREASAHLRTLDSVPRAT